MLRYSEISVLALVIALIVWLNVPKLLAPVLVVTIVGCSAYRWRRGLWPWPPRSPSDRPTTGENPMTQEHETGKESIGGPATRMDPARTTVDGAAIPYARSMRLIIGAMPPASAQIKVSPGTSLKSARLRVQSDAPWASAQAATARSISRPRGRLTAL